MGRFAIHASVWRMSTSFQWQRHLVPCYVSLRHVSTCLRLEFPHRNSVWGGIQVPATDGSGCDCSWSCGCQPGRCTKGNNIHWVSSSHSLCHLWWFCRSHRGQKGRQVPSLFGNSNCLHYWAWWFLLSRVLWTPPWRIRVRLCFSPWSHLTASSRHHIAFAQWNCGPYCNVSEGWRCDVYSNRQTHCCVALVEYNRNGPYSRGEVDYLGWYLSAAGRISYLAGQMPIYQHASTGVSQLLP